MLEVSYLVPPPVFAPPFAAVPPPPPPPPVAAPPVEVVPIASVIVRSSEDGPGTMGPSLGLTDRLMAEWGTKAPGVLYGYMERSYGFSWWWAPTEEAAEVTEAAEP